MVTLTLYSAINIHCKSGGQGRTTTPHWGTWLPPPVFKRIKANGKELVCSELVGTSTSFFIQGYLERGLANDKIARNVFSY